MAFEPDCNQDGARVRWDHRKGASAAFGLRDAFAPDLQSNGTPVGRPALHYRENSLTNQSNAASLASIAKEAAVVASGSRLDREWSVPMFEAAARNRGVNAADHLLGIFDVLDDVINRADRPARAFLVRLGRVSSGAPATEEDRLLVSELRAVIMGLASETQIADAGDLLLSWWVLMKGSILKALDGDLGSAVRARAMAVDLIARHARPTHLPIAQSYAERIDFDAYFDWALTDEADELL
jgi:hypothetical protein